MRFSEVMNDLYTKGGGVVNAVSFFYNRFRPSRLDFVSSGEKMLSIDIASPLT